MSSNKEADLLAILKGKTRDERAAFLIQYLRAMHKRRKMIERELLKVATKEITCTAPAT